MRRIVLAQAAMALLLTGCGGDSQALSTTEFQKQANAICKDGDAELAEKGKKLFGPDGRTTPTPEALAAYFTDDALPVARTKLDRIDRLDPPEGDRRKVDRMLAAGRKGISEADRQLKKDPVAYFSGKIPDPFAEFNQRAGDLGLNDCTAKQ